ncbi:hypothetical protein [Corynebacterium sp. A21]|uniref:hypothetical protein n=1 Tax=Corynebacterium sp. A21 TaxID=3457318 RepID=UPI003FD46429
MQHLESGRFNILLLIIVGMGALISVISSAEWLTSAGLSIALLALLFFAVIQVRWSRRMEGERRARIAKLERQVHKFTTTIPESLRNISESVGTGHRLEEQIQRDVAKLEANIADHLDLMHHADQAETTNYFDPRMIEATEIKGKPAAHQAGRMAAHQEMAEESSYKYGLIFGAFPSKNLRILSIIGDQELQNHLAPIASIQRVGLGGAQLSLPSQASYLVIQENYLDSGTWRGTLDAQGSGKFRSIASLLRKAKKDGVVVIVVASEITRHFTWSLRKNADILVENGKANVRWENDVDLPVLQAILTYSSEHEN